MSLDEAIIVGACANLKEEYAGRVKSLGYTNFSVMYSKSADNEIKNQIIVLAEFYRPLFESREDKARLRKLIPRRYDYEGNKLQVALEYVKLPAKVRKQISAMAKFRQK